MNHIKSLGLLLRGIATRIYWLIPAIMSDPWDLAERWFGIKWNPPVWLGWVLLATGLFIAIFLAYHELRMQKLAFEPANWIEKYKREHHKLPPIPDYFHDIVPSYVKGEPITLNIEVIPMSGQFWNRLLPSQKQELREMLEFLKINPDDYIAKMQRMLPTSSPTPIHIKYSKPNS